jgi:hypothetical protein
MNATVIMISQGAMALGGVMWGSAASLAGASYTLLGAAVLFLTSQLLARRLSINFAGNLEEGFSGDLSIRVEPEEETPIALTRELCAAWMHGGNDSRLCRSRENSAAIRKATDEVEHFSRIGLTGTRN